MNTEAYCLILFVSIAIALAAQEPTGIVMLFRHGARGPTGNQWDKTWGNMYGELTSVGIRQEYIRGAYLRKLYPKLFAKYEPNKIYIRSTDVNRTIMSAYSMLYGLYEGNGPSFSADYPLNRTYPLYPNYPNDTDLTVFPYGFQPIPIHTLETSKDELLKGYSVNMCTYGALLEQLQKESPELSDVWDKFYDTQDRLRMAFNFSRPLTREQVHTLYDTMIANYFEGKPLPGGIDPTSELAKNLTFLFSYTDYFTRAGTPLQRQLYTMTTLNQFRDDLDSILHGSKNVIRLYSAHDSNLVPILAILGIANHECLYKNFFEGVNSSSCIFPIYASAIRLELFKNDTDGNSSTVKCFFNEVEQNICNSTDGHCTWAAFKSLVQNYTQGKNIDFYHATCAQPVNPPDFDNKTNGGNGTKPNPKNKNFTGLYIALYSLTGISGVLFVGIIVIYRKKKNYETLPEDESNAIPETH